MLAKMFYPGLGSLIQRYSCWLFSLSGMACWNQYPARWLASVLSLRLHSTRCAFLLEGKITVSILARTVWTSSATDWGTTKLDQPFPLQRTDYLVLCFCRFPNLHFLCFIINYVKLTLYCSWLACYLCMKMYHTVQFVAAISNHIATCTTKKLMTETFMCERGYVWVMLILLCFTFTRRYS